MSSLNSHTATSKTKSYYLKFTRQALSLRGCVLDKSQCTILLLSPTSVYNLVNLDFKDYQVRSEGEQSLGIPHGELISRGAVCWLSVMCLSTSILFSTSLSALGSWRWQPTPMGVIVLWLLVAFSPWLASTGDRGGRNIAGYSASQEDKAWLSSRQPRCC